MLGAQPKVIKKAAVIAVFCFGVAGPAFAGQPSAKHYRIPESQMLKYLSNKSIPIQMRCHRENIDKLQGNAEVTYFYTLCSPASRWIDIQNAVIYAKYQIFAEGGNPYITKGSPIANRYAEEMNKAGKVYQKWAKGQKIGWGREPQMTAAQIAEHLHPPAWKPEYGTFTDPRAKKIFDQTARKPFDAKKFAADLNRFR